MGDLQQVPRGAPTGPSYLREIPRRDAVVATKAIGAFFGVVQEQVQAVKAERQVTYPKGSAWIIGSGSTLLVAALCASVFRDSLPPNTPGIYLALGGLSILVAGGIYRHFWAKENEVQAKPEVKIAEIAYREITNQIEHFKEHAYRMFGPAAEGTHRAILQGVGKRSWNGDREIAIREFEKDCIYASVVHLVAVDITPPLLSVRQVGLDLSTGTISEDSTYRHPLSDVASVSRNVKQNPAIAKWDDARQIVADLVQLEKQSTRVGDQFASKIAELKAELENVQFDEPTCDEFTLSFVGGETVALRIADSEFAKNARQIAYPVGGNSNREAADVTWKVIQRAAAVAKADWQRHREVLARNTEELQKGLAGVQQGIADLQAPLLIALDGLQQRLASLELAFRGVEAGMSAGRVASGAALQDPIGESAAPQRSPAPKVILTGQAAVSPNSQSAVEVTGPTDRSKPFHS